MDKEDIMKQFDLMQLRQTKIIVENQAIDVKLKKSEAHMERTLKEVNDIVLQLNKYREDNN